jgi:hypothetical protein
MLHHSQQMVAGWDRFADLDFLLCEHLDPAGPFYASLADHSRAYFYFKTRSVMTIAVNQRCAQH